MARKILKKQTVTFYEGDEQLLEKVEAAAKASRQSFQAFVLSALEDKVVGANIPQSNQIEVPTETKDKVQELGW